MIAAKLIFAAVLTALVVFLAGGTPFVLHPAGAMLTALFFVWMIVTTFGRQRGKQTKYDHASWVYVVLGGIGSAILVLVAPWEHSHFDGPLARSGTLPASGLAVFGAGILLQAWAMWTLRGFFTVRLGVRQGQHVQTGGPYRLVRHPGYLSYLIILTGFGLALGSLAALALTVSSIPFLIWRIHIEEKMLLSEFGEGYTQYSRNTRYRIIPFVY